MSEPTPLKVAIRPPSDLSKGLRELADLVDRGIVTEFVGAYCENGHYAFWYGASLHSCVVLSTLLQQNCVDRMRI